MIKRRQKCAAVMALVLCGCGDGSTATREITHAQDNSSMVVIPAGELLMGAEEDHHPDLLQEMPPPGKRRPSHVLRARAAPAWSHADERPQHAVKLTAFAVDKFEVTNAQYRQFLSWIESGGDHRHCHPDEPENKNHAPRYWGEFNPLLQNPDYAKTTPFGPATFTKDDMPVTGVDWFDAVAYATWAGKRLPTEAEWEYAARGADGRRWPWGNEWMWGRANTGGEKMGKDIWAQGVEKDGYIYPAPVGSFSEGKSPFGIHDMAGNVAEWCADWYDAKTYARKSGAADPQGPTTGAHRVVRGGSSRNLPSGVRTTGRAHFEPEFRVFSLGFRCAKDLD